MYLEAMHVQTSRRSLAVHEHFVVGQLRNVRTGAEGPQDPPQFVTTTFKSKGNLRRIHQGSFNTEH